ncbi:uncharacterized protein LOC143082888 isoform X1 [Mytilus galloprovincialis]|uniref:uncharacterized protein LOC143082888 isoform X1 n=2 Tax=Mytilus galloprovincialis TaxID=29158 RepID=UPI003F7B752F
MNKVMFLFVCCLAIAICQASWRSQNKNKWRNYARRMNFINTTWTNTVGNVNVAESAIYRDGLDVVFVKSRDTVNNEAIGFNTSFFIYDVNAALGAISVKSGRVKFCFIAEMDDTKTMDIVKQDLEALKNGGNVVKDVVPIYVSQEDAATVQTLMGKSRMISAICSKAANCDRAYMASTQQGDKETVATWKTSGMYNNYEINMSMNPDSSNKNCRDWVNFWTKP